MTFLAFSERKQVWIPLDLRGVLLGFQLLSLFAALLFTAGGGLEPGRAAGSFIYIKALLFALPLGTAFFLFLIQPRRILAGLTDILRENRWLLFYVVFCGFSIPFAVDWSFSLNRLLYMMYGLASVFGLVLCYGSIYPDFVQRTKAFADHLKIVTVSLLMLMSLLLLRNGFNDLVPGFRMTLVRELPVHPNILSSYMAMLLLWHFSLASLSRATGAWVFSVLLFASIVLLFSRSVFGCLAASLAIMGFFGFLWHRRQTLFILVLSFFLMLLIAILCALLGVISLEGLLEPVLRNQSIESFFGLNHRVDLWRLMLSKVMLKNMLVGNGYAVVTQDFSVDVGSVAVHGAHSAYLSIFLGSGFLALLAFLLWIVSVLAKSFRSRFSHPPATVMALLGGTVFFALNGFFEEQAGVATSAVLAHLLLLANIVIKPSRSRQ